MDDVIKWLGRHNYGATKQALINADLIMENKFIFTHPYDMEPYNKVVEFTEIDWLYTPNDDEEWTFMLNRQEYLLDLLVAFQLTNQSRYLIKAKKLLFDWQEKCLDQLENWRTIDTGIRLMYWALILKELKAHSLLTAKEESQIVEAITIQVSYLDEGYVSKYDLSNWGVLITSGIIVMGNIHPASVTQEVFQRSLKRLGTQIKLQVQGSGLHWEQSPLYFMEVWRHLAMVWQSFPDGYVACPVEIEGTVRLMLQASIHQVKPSGYLLQQGDTDSIRITDMIQTVSLLLNEPLPASLGERLEIDLLLVQMLKFNKISIHQWPDILCDLTTTDLPKTLVDYQTGNYYYRDNWSQEASFLHLFNGPIGSGHGHASLGHIDFVFQGVDVLVDPGRYTYRESKERLFLKGSQAHNVLTLNQEPFCIPKDSWGFQKASTPLGNQSSLSESHFAGEVTYNDHQGTNVYRVTRTYLWLKEERLLVVFDYCQGNQLKLVEQRLTFSPELSVSHEGAELLLEGSGLKQGLKIWSNYQEGQLESCLYSPSYNELSQTEQFHGTQQVMSGTFVGCTVIGITETVEQLTVQQSGTAESVAAGKCFAVGVQTKAHHYAIVLQSEDTFAGHKLYYVNEQPIYGKLAVLKDKVYQRLL